MRKDKVAAMKLARLKVKANARGAAPPPPGKGGPAPPIVTSDGEPPKVEKYRAIEAHTGDVTFPVGATLFVLGEPDDKGEVVGVYDGISGNVPISKLVVITPELLAKEREEKEAVIKAEFEAREAEINKEKEKIEAQALEKLKALDSKEPQTSDAPGETEEEKLAALAKAEADKKVADEIDSMKAEEDKLLAEARRLEELMAALDMSDDEDAL